MSERRRTSDGGFRALLVAGAIVSVILGVWGLVWTQMFDAVLGIPAEGPGVAAARLYGGVLLAVGVAYALAAAQPHGSRALLVLLLLVPLANALVAVAGVARDEIAPGKGLGFAAVEIIYCLLYFRAYPRIAEPERETESEPSSGSADPLSPEPT